MRLKFWSRGSNQVTRPAPVVLTDEDGKVLEPWEVRAGMLLFETTYSHRDRAVVGVVRMDRERARR